MDECRCGRCSGVVPEQPIIHILRGPDGKRYTDEYKSAKWCRRCRKKLVHRGVILYDTEPSYYDPVFAWECPCGAIS